jgi:hypothetical protein
MVQFSKLDVLVFLAKPKCLVLADRTYVSFNINCCESLVMCITYYMFTHTFVAPHRCIDIEELSWIFLKNVQNCVLGQN